MVDSCRCGEQLPKTDQIWATQCQASFTISYIMSSHCVVETHQTALECIAYKYCKLFWVMFLKITVLVKQNTLQNQKTLALGHMSINTICTQMTWLLPVCFNLIKKEKSQNIIPLSHPFSFVSHIFLSYLSGMSYFAFFPSLQAMWKGISYLFTRVSERWWMPPPFVMHTRVSSTIYENTWLLSGLIFCDCLLPCSYFEANITSLLCQTIAKQCFFFSCYITTRRSTLLFSLNLFGVESPYPTMQDYWYSTPYSVPPFFL